MIARARPGLALATTLAVQMLASFVLTVPSVLAPVVAPMLGYPPERVGTFVGVAYFAAMLSGLWSGQGVAGLGAVRLSQAAMLACAAGTIAATAGAAVVLLASAVLVGIGYGVINPASATLLDRHSPPGRHGLFFSAKQAGVPLGVALSGLVMPWGLFALGWQASAVGAGLTCAALALVLVPAVDRLEPGARRANRWSRWNRGRWNRSSRAGGASHGGGDDRRHPPAPDAELSAEPLNAPAPRLAPDAAQAPPPVQHARGASALRTVLRDPDLRRLSLASLTFACTQLAFVTFLVSLLNLQLGHSLAWSAGILALAQVVSTIARIGLGYVGDRWIAPGLLLGVLGLAMALACAGLAVLDAQTGAAWVVLAASLCAATGMGWNGVFFAQLARTASGRADLATVAGASQFFTFAGSMSGPVLFAEIVRAGGSYSTGYLSIAVLPAVAGIVLLRAWFRRA